MFSRHSASRACARPRTSGGRAARLWLVLACLSWLGARPAARDGHARRTHDVREQECEFTVITEPPGAEVVFKAIARTGFQRGGKADPQLKLRLPVGPYWIEVNLPRYRPQRQMVAVVRDAQLRVVLQPASARLEVATAAGDDTARGGEVRVDGRLSGTVPVPIEVTAGPHQIEVHKPGYRAHRETVVVEADEARTLWVTLQATVRSGTLLVKAGPGRIFIDGVERGAAPLVLDNIAEGPHTVELRGPAGVIFSRRVEVPAGQRTEVGAP